MKLVGASNDASRLSVLDWLAFLIGRREAIVDVARSRMAIWVGLLFVLSAGLAREYDGAYLLGEPWHLILPLVASLATSLVLYILIYLAKEAHGLEQLGWWSGYRTLLTFYWFTAPLAWIYAVPVEWFLSPADAMQANLAFLAVVSVWRVLLITRALSVWLGESFWALLWVALFFAVSVALVLATVTPTPVWNIMGGIRLPEREQVILSTKLMVWFFGIPLWIILGIGTCFVLSSRKRIWSLSAVAGRSELTVGKSLWCFAVLLLVAGLSLLPFAQPAQQRAWQVDRLLAKGEVDSAINQMSQLPRDAFPLHWDPPPHPAYGREDGPNVVEVLIAAKEAEAPIWVKQLFIEKLLAQYSGITQLLVASSDEDIQLVEELFAFLKEHPPRGEFRHSLYRQLDDARKNDDLDPAIRKMIRGFRDEIEPSDDE